MKGILGFNYDIDSYDEELCKIAVIRDLMNIDVFFEENKVDYYNYYLQQLNYVVFETQFQNEKPVIKKKYERYLAKNVVAERQDYLKKIHEGRYFNSVLNFEVFFR